MVNPIRDENGNEKKNPNLTITIHNPHDRITGDKFANSKKRSYSNSDDEDDFDNFKRPRRKMSDLDKEYDRKIFIKSRECDYFKKLTRKRQMEILDKEDEIYKYHQEDVPLRYRILFADISIATKSMILQKIDQFDSMNKYDSEYSKLNKWLKGLARIPFGNYVNMPVAMNDDQLKIQKFLLEANRILDKTIYGQYEAKNKIIQIMAQWISNPLSHGQVIALEGPPGVGKTSLIKNGVSKALNRPFCFYALGGASDASNLEGHSYTYEGASWGRIVEMFMESKVMNPILFFDELDKISDTPKGAEITGVLTHLTDPTQNNTFYDKYFSGVEFDLSKTLYFFSYNHKELINPILKDRLTVIKFDGYKMKEKIKITKEYMIPEFLQNHVFEEKDIVIEEKDIEYLIQHYCEDEKGVRNIRRCFEDIFLKLNLLRLIHGKGGSTDEQMNIPYDMKDFQLPFKLTSEKIDLFLKKSSFEKKKNDHSGLLYI